VIAITPTADRDVTDVRFRFACTGIDAAPRTPALNTLLLSASAAPTPDVVALVATLQNDGIVHVPGVGATGVFAISTVNVGGSGTVTASVDAGAVTLPLEATICETDATTVVLSRRHGRDRDVQRPESAGHLERGQGLLVAGGSHDRARSA
jgi:hypothetical protein